MAQTKPEYAECTEFGNYASQLVSKFPEVFGALDVSKVKCVAITNKDRSEKKNLWEVKAVPYPIRMDCPYAYYVVIFMKDWTEMDESHKAALVAETLHAIPSSEDEEGKTNPFDLKDYGNMIRTLGVDYMEKDGIPNLIKDDVKWVLR
jgi:hypothetical protein